MSKSYVYNGLGFPVVVMGVRPRKTPYGDGLGIDHEMLRKALFKMLIEKPGRFLGAEIKFIRHEFGLSQEVFADLIFSERSSVAKWEKKDLKPTGMSESTEIMLRIEMSKQIKQKDINKVYDKACKSVRSEEQEILRFTA